MMVRNKPDQILYKDQKYLSANFAAIVIIIYIYAMPKENKLPTSIEVIKASPDRLPDPDSMQLLFSQLTNKKILSSTAKILEIVSQDNACLFMAIDKEENDQLVGLVVMVVYRVFSAKHAHIEDLVVDEKYRGRGIAEELMQHAMTQARLMQANYVNLTCSPTRKAANSLYHKLGFTLRATNVFNYALDK